ncbi:MAG: hypothetical protein GKS00_11365 [Alphaproteobacteria bacterium]|nr:hypothetical protein [Alphaproteobacteria bacterium]NKC02284.1 hypothetical protein [Pseudomonadales bacterium]
MFTLSFKALKTGRVPSPFKGGPPTIVTTDNNGTTNITVQLHAVTPLRAKLSLYAALVSGAALLAFGTQSLIIDGSFSALAFAKLGGASVLTVPLALLALRQLLKRSATVRFTPNRITVHKILGARFFERAHPHSFVLLPHDKAEKEQDRHAFLDRKRPPKWWSLKRKKYYSTSFHVVLECFGERHDILTVYGRKKATAFQARLQACDAVMDGADFGDSGISLSPDADWNVEAGGL